MNTETHRLLDSNEPLCHASTALSDLIEASPYPTHLADAQTGQYICCNSEFSDYIGIPIKDICGLTVETCFNQRQWEEKAKTDLFHWWRETEPENLRRFDEEVQKTHQRIQKQRLSIRSTGLILFKETAKTPVLSRDRKTVIAILTQSRDITLHCNLFDLLDTYQRYYADQAAVQNMLITLDIDGYFDKLPTLEEMKVLLALRDGRSEDEASRHIRSRQERMSVDDWHEMLTRLRMMPLDAH